ncbi:hypothetical protein [uncultured Sphingomonas sp.]|uniref:hypothetical protein n=1 Tax=uncultured Sphingomonas sp. TaxID=158754 RepID=UPI0025D35B72|nr:hypothetical protein [uncultured Sphingomonas sp.]
MTKQRPPVSIENTLYRVLGELGIDRAAGVTGREAHYLRGLSDHDRREQLTVRDMIALDVACREAGDPTFPFYETVGLLLKEASAERLADAAAIGRHAQVTARESGEALAAIMAAAIAAGTDPKLIDNALREAEEAHGAFADVIATLCAQKAKAEPPP